MLIALILQLAATDPMAVYREQTKVTTTCIFDADETDVTVCGLRNADRFRVPFVVRDPGDPLHEAVRVERERYLARTDNCEEMRSFLTGCGSAGVTVGTGGVRGGTLRSIAP